jgi:hypothetical protein
LNRIPFYNLMVESLTAIFIMTRQPLIWKLCFLTLFPGLNAIRAQTDLPARQQEVADTTMPFVILGEELDQVNLALPDGGLPPLPGVYNIQLMRATRDRPALAEGEGWTYAHHQDLAVWQGRLYAAWAMTPIHEDLPPYRVLFATSGDGSIWTDPADLFPRGWAWATRFYFYCATNGKMLALCTGRMPEVKDITEAIKSVLLVREITRDHRLGEVYTLIGRSTEAAPAFATAADPELTAACREAAENNLFLEQSDYGNLLGEHRMKWHDITPKYKGFYPFGKAFCFYHRADGKIVGVCKMGFTTVSDDGGQTWSEPVLPPTLKTGAGKVWGQRTPDDQYILVYNPDDVTYKRYPLVLVQGTDGRTFHGMRVVHGEYPVMRYPGRYKDFGPQYVRGLAEWSNDGSFGKDAVWLIYSVHKEDIWLSRIPLPLKTGVTAYPVHDFQQSRPGEYIEGWNVYHPCWAPVNVVKEPGNPDNRCLELRDGDPYDYARAKCLFPPTAILEARMRIKPLQTAAQLEIELSDGHDRRPFRFRLGPNEHLYTQDGDYSVDLGNYYTGEWMELRVQCNQFKGAYSLSVNGTQPKVMRLADAGAGPMQMISLRTGAWRGITADPLRYNQEFDQTDSNLGPVDAGTDVPALKPAVYLIDDVSVRKIPE